MADQIWLTGFMGTGKSRIVRPVAAALDWEAADTDAVVEARAGESIAQIFARGGEAAFRTLESEAIDELAGRARIVVATGGGAVLSEQNRATMRRRGFVVALDARPETILQRLRDAGERISERPLLRGGDPLAQIVSLKEARAPLYAQADAMIQTDELTPDQVTHRVLQAFREHESVGAGEDASRGGAA